MISKSLCLMLKILNKNKMVIKEFNKNGEQLARFFFVQDPDGYKIEVLQEGGHYR